MLQSSIEQGGPQLTAQRRGVDGREHEKPPETWSSRPHDKELTGNCSEPAGPHAGGHNDARRMTCRRGLRELPSGTSQ